MTSSFIVNNADLAFILKQIKIAENTSIGYTPAVAPVSIKQAIMNAYGVSAADAALLPYGLRTVDGTYNNLLSDATKDFGAADTLFPRLTDPSYQNAGDEGTGFNGITNTNYGAAGNVVDSDPRIISNLIVDMSINNPAAIQAFLNNPLSVEAFQELYPGKNPVAPGQVVNPNDQALTNADLQIIPNQSPDIGLSPGFNSWMNFFGQFFDHGLDLVTKGNNGTVYIPLQADDPLIAGADGILNTGDDLAPNLRFMALTRTTPTFVDPDGAGPLPAVAQQENTTTSFVDQNQTYTSHASHQVFLREYVKVDIDGAGGNGPVAVSTGKLIDGSAASGSVNGAIGNWGEVKAQALDMFGIRLSDFDIHNVPLLVTDQYGKFIPGANGYAQLVMSPDATHTNNWVKEGTAAGISTEGSIGTGHAFLNDIAHHAAPGFVDTNHNGVRDASEMLQTADLDTGVGNDNNPNTYDNEMLDAHFLTGDGRGNENVALTAVHSIFHSEHNRMVEANKATILASNDLAFINEWLLVDVNAVPASVAGLTWDGERLFQAARFTTEMQYQHLVFEEFARRIQPMVDPFVFNNSPDLDPTIVAEFAHTVYRFGHSMLTGTVDRLENDLTTVNGDANQQTLLAMFLNPQAYIGSGATLEQINANIIRGLSRDVGNAIDEFIVTDVRSNLLGLPLDLGALNIARGRETGIPSLNETRAQLYNDTGLANLKPYSSWADFSAHIKNAASIVNFIAAYGTHASIASATTLADKRLAAEELVFGTDGPDAGTSVVTTSDRSDFLNATGAYATKKGGLDDVDLWIGGLAEANPEFGGMLGTTFNFVFEMQMEKLQFGDRMYYLTRTQGTNFLNQLEPNTFSDLVMRNTELGDKYSTHLNAALFVTPDHILELDRGIAQTDYDGGASGLDPLWGPGEQHSILTPLKVTRTYTGVTADGGHDVGGTIQFVGGEHVVLGGTEGNDELRSDRGIDAIWGDGGNDYINAGTESDDVFGGEGDDVIEDPFGDDVLRGNQGNDYISSASGADLLFGDQGSDYILIGQDAAEAFGGNDNDFILGGDGKDLLLGNEGDDWIEGGPGFDLLAGDNSELFFNSSIIGHDVLFGHGDETDYDAESGDDIMGSGPSVFRYEGMFGFDWGIGKNDTSGVQFDLQIPIFTTIPVDVLRDRFDQTEALSGWKYDDHLDGDDRGHKGGGSSAPDSVPTELFAEHLLTQEGINRIDGFQDWMQGARQTLFGGASPVPGSTPVTTYRDGNILMGGGGNDFLRGRGGYDLLDGDAWLNVRIKIVIPAGNPNAGTYSAESMTTETAYMGEHAGKVFHTNPADGSPDFSRPAFGGVSLNSLIKDRVINPGQMSIVREILDGTPGATTDTDTAIFQGTLAEYDIEGRTTDGVNGSGVVTGQARDVDGDGFIYVRDRDTGAIGATIIGLDGVTPVTLSSRGLLTDDRDLLKNIERLQFADQTIAIGSNALATGNVTISDLTPYDGKVTPYVGQVLVPTLMSFIDPDVVPLDSSGKPVGLNFEWQTTEFGSNSGWSTITTAQTYTVRSVDPGHVLRAVAVFKDSKGVTERIFSNSTDNPTVAFSVNENSVGGTVVGLQIPFSVDYDSQSIGGLPPVDVDLNTLYHEIDPANSAYGRFKVVRNGVDFNDKPRYSLVVDNGGPVLLDYEAAQTPIDNQYQVIINSYSDLPANGGTLVAVRQFTVLLNDVLNEVGQLAPTPIRSADFNGDGKSDLLWRNTYTGEAYTYQMNGFTVAAERSLRNVSNDWKDSGTGDFNGDGNDDILWRNANSGEAYIYQMNGLAVAAEGSLRIIDSSWKFAATGDFNGDGKDDILWRNANSGEAYIYQMNGLAVAAEGAVRTVSNDWKIFGTGDFNGDNKSDILWRNANTGSTYIYLMNGLSVASEGAVRTVANDLVIKGIDDFNGDGKDDILWRSTSNGDTSIYQMNGLVVAAEGMIGQTTTNDHKQSHWNITGTGDYNGDGKGDILWRHTNGTAYVWNMNGLNMNGEGVIRQVDSSWQIAAPTI
jgi:Ca2+-binding RTX toxin-like protein